MGWTAQVFLTTYWRLCWLQMSFTKLAVLKDLFISDIRATLNNWLVKITGPRGSTNKDATGAVVWKKTFLEVLEIIFFAAENKAEV